MNTLMNTLMNTQMNTMKHSRAVALLAVLSACTNFDQENKIEDTRVLGVKTFPAEILYSPLFLTAAAQRPPLPLPSVDVDVQVFAFDPRGGRTKVSVQMCPQGATDSSCRLYQPETDIAAEPAAAQADVRALLTPRVVEGAIAAAASPIGKITPDHFSYSFTPAVIDFFIPDDDNGNPIPNVLPLLPRFVVEVENLDAKTGEVKKERAFKRIPLAVDLTSADLPPQVAADIASSLGITLCTTEDPLRAEGFKQGLAACLARRVPNTNPALIGFNFEPDADKLTQGYVYAHNPLVLDGDSPALAQESLLVSDPGAAIAITPVYTEGTVERYQVLTFSIEQSRLLLQNREEDFVNRWYCTRGNVSQTQTTLQFTDALGVVWTLPPDAKAGERDSLYVVVLDQRGGTSFGQITVEYR